MSKRPSTSNGVLSRLRRPAALLRDLPIWSKLGLIMVVPTIATVVVGLNGLVSHIQQAREVDRTRSLAMLAEVSGQLVHGLQDERASAVILLGTTDAGARQSRTTAYHEVHRVVDEAHAAYAQRGNAISDLPANMDRALDDITRNLDELGEVRGQVENGKITISGAKDWYQLLVNDLLAIGESSAQLAGDNDLSDQMRAAAAVSREKEYLSLQRTVVLNAFSLREMTPKLKRDFIATRTGQEQALQSFQSVATSSERALYDQTVSGSALREASSRAGDVEQLVGTNTSALPFDLTDWDSAMVGHAKLLRDVEARLDRDMVSAATSLRDQVTRTVLLETGALLGMLLLAVLFAWLVARSMARSLRELRQGALSVAQYGLPQAVSRLRDPALTSQMSPQQVAAQIAEPLPVRSRDEFGQVTEAFNVVHLEAVRTAAEQAALRASVATMFVNLARRSQILVDRLIGHLDRLERGEEDPDALAELFQLDHLATRMRRNDENLLVLAGADSTRVQREPASLLDVLRAAQSEVEHYTRIEFGMIDRDIEVAAHAVNDLVHLLAELFDNATAFSPPDSHVVIEARRVGDLATLYVEDRGIGISAEQLAELNERLAAPPAVDVTVSRMMGLVVVARLAARHGVKVELRRGADRGTVADVVLPVSVLVPRALAGRPAGVEDTVPSSVAPGQRASDGLLALESGPPVPSHPATSGAASFADAFSDGSSGYDSASTMPGGFDEPVSPARDGLLGPAATSHALPAWSDLTGAAGATGINGNGGAGRNGSHGPNGAPGSGPTFPPAAPGRVPPGDPFSGPLPKRTAADPWSADDEGAESQAGPVTPPWQAPPPEARGSLPRRPVPPPSEIPPVSAPPVPPYGSIPPATAGPVVSGPPAAMPLDATPVVSGPPAVSPVVSGPPAGTPPPTWPPIAPAPAGDEPPAVPGELAAALDMTAELPKIRPVAEQETEPAPDAGALPDDTEAPSQGAVDMDATATLLRPVSAPPPAAAPPLAVPPPATASPTGSVGPVDPVSPGGPVSPVTAVRTPDETMELPIFRELESAWFRTRRPATDSDPATEPGPATGIGPETTGAGPETGSDGPSNTPVPSSGVPFQAPASAPPAPDQGWETAPPAWHEPEPASNGARSDVTYGTTAGSNSMVGAPMPAGAPSWHTAADDGWRAASAATEVSVSETTATGLPKRVPMAQLVPGGIERPAAATQRRTPEGVRGLLSAYHRGVQRGRSEPKDGDHGPGISPEPTTAGPQQQGGKEQEA